MTTDASRDPELFDAIAAAYALVATADHDLADVEIDRLRGWGREQGFGGSDIDELSARCRAFGQAILAHASSNRKAALERVRAVRDGGKRATLVLGAARVAVVADARLEETEEQVLRQIATALGLDPDSA